MSLEPYSIKYWYILYIIVKYMAGSHLMDFLFTILLHMKYESFYTSRNKIALLPVISIKSHNLFWRVHYSS